MSGGEISADLSGSIVIDEIVNIDTETAEVKYGSQRSDFASVVFHSIAETYPEDAHIECRYTVTSDLVPTTRDWVALYKVGWMAPKDYIYYEWAPVPKEYKVGEDADASVLFPAHQLPKDDGEFYQFCYVSSSAQVRGASTPFQFHRPGADDFVEVEDEETNMLVIQSKTAFLQENLQQAEAQKNKLIEAQENIRKERDDVVTKYMELKKKLDTKETENKALTGRLSDSDELVAQQRKEARDMMMCREELENRLKTLKQERTTLEQNIAGLTSKITSLMSEMKSLQSEKDELSGKNATLAEQVDLYKNHYATSETTADKYSKQSEELQIKLAKQESLIDHLKHTSETLSKELEENKQNLDTATEVGVQNKDRMSDLEERIKNAEDKLSAVEQSKTLLQEEITAYKETHQQLNTEIEKSKSECLGLKQKLGDMEDDFTQKCTILQVTIDQANTECSDVKQEKEKLEDEVSQLQQQLDSHLVITDTSKGSMTIMKQSLTQIKERLDKKDKHCRSLEKTLATKTREYLQTEHDLRREIEDLKEKIFMCSEEYKSLYIDKNKLQKKLEKSLAKKKTRAIKQPMTSSLTSSMVEVEMPQTSAAITGEITESDPTTEEIDRQVDEFEKEMDKNLLKKQKYKNLYNKEKENIESLMKAHSDELRKKEDEIDQLKKTIKEVPSTWDLKVRSLEKCVTEKELIIEDLNQKLRTFNQGRNDETGASTLPQRPTGPPNESKYPYMVYGSGNAYAHDAAPTPQMPNTCNSSWYMYPQQYPIQYPQQQIPAMVYPRQASLMQYPSHGADGQQAGCTGSNLKYPLQKNSQVDDPLEIPIPRNQSENSDDILDKTENQPSFLEKPLTSLPPPLVPEVLPSAKISAVRTSGTTLGLDEPDSRGFDYLSSETDLKVTLPSAPPATEPKEDRFYDAEGSSMKICHVCSKTFPADLDDAVFQEHQLLHVDGICPVCNMMKNEEMSDDDFERHVNKHYDNDNCDLY